MLRAIPHPAGVMLHAEAALSRTARFFATTEFLNGKVRLHDLLQGRQLYELVGSSPERLMGESLTLIEPAFSQGERMVATGGDSLGARLTALPDGRRLATVTHEAGAVTSVAFRSDGQLVVTSGDDGTARFWTVTGQPLGVLAGHDGQLNHAEFSADGRLVVTAGADGVARSGTLRAGRPYTF